MIRYILINVIYACPLSSRDGLLVCSYTWLTFPLSHAQWILPKGTRSTVILFPLFCFSFAQFFPSKYYITYIAKVTTTTASRLPRSLQQRHRAPRRLAAPVTLCLQLLLLFFSLVFFSSEKSFKREWKMAAIWQLSPKVSASMVFCLALVWRQEDSSRWIIYINGQEFSWTFSKGESPC